MMAQSKKYFFIGNELFPIFKKNENVRQVLLEENITESIDEISKCDGLIILVETAEVFQELISKTETPTGIAVAQQLRLKGYSGPILFTSHSSRLEIYSNKADREILNVIGHDFLQLPQPANYFVELINNINSLDNLELYDIQNSCCRKDGIVKELTHRLNSRSNVGQKQLFSDTIQSIALVYNQDASLFISDFEMQYPEITIENISSATADVTKFGESLIKQFSSANSGDRFLEDITSRKWKLLWIDDEADQNHTLLKILNSKGIQVQLCSSADTALDLLEEDWKTQNEIGVILADYRLYEIKDNVRIQQTIQGYKLLSEIAQSGRMIRLAALSALPRKILLHSFKHFNIRTAVYSKKDYLEDEITRRLLCEELIEMGDENQEAIISMPDDASGWKFLKQTYKQYRNSFEYVTIETRISEKALSNVYYYEQYHSLAEPIGFKKSNFNGDKDKKKNLEKFQPYWLARRVGLWLGVVKKLPNEKIAEILRCEPCSDYKQVISQYLGLRIEDFPLSLTIEEKNWFHYSLGIPVYKHIEVTNTILRKIENQFEKFLTKKTKFLLLLKQNQFSATFEHGNNRLVIHFSESGRPTLKSFHYVRVLYRVLIIQLKLPDQEALSFSRTLKSIIQGKIESLKAVEITRSVKLVYDYFKRESSLLSNEPVNSISNQEKEFILKMFDAIRNNKIDMLHSKKEQDLIADILIAYNDFCLESELSAEEFLSKFVNNRVQQRTKDNEWKKVMNNSVTKKGENKLDFKISGDAEEYI